MLRVGTLCVRENGSHRLKGSHAKHGNQREYMSKYLDGKFRSAKIKHSDFLHPALEKACRFRLLQKTATLNFCTPCCIIRHFPSTEYAFSRTKTFCQPLKNKRFSALHKSTEAMKEADNIIKSRFSSFSGLEENTGFSVL